MRYLELKQHFETSYNGEAMKEIKKIYVLDIC